MVNQKLQVKLENVPANTSLVRRSTTRQLNRDENLSAVEGDGVTHDHKRTCNNAEVNTAQRTGRIINAFVFVLDIHGNPLMPCTYAKSKKLCKRGDAKLIKCYPYVVIQLTYDVKGKTQPVTIGVDTGGKHIGISAIGNDKEYVSVQLELDNKTPERMKTRAMYRRGRRNKHHWYRKPRFNNRTKAKGWLPPSTERKISIHKKIIDMLCKYIPVSKIVCELGKFDIQKINNPDIEGIGYQQGEQLNYSNVKAFVYARENYTCQLCKKSVIGHKANVHHIKERHNGGTDKPSNLALLHESCHKKLHKNNLTLKLTKAKTYKESTFINILSSRLKQMYPAMIITYGYITSARRIELGLEKSHVNDAFVIAGGSTEKRCATKILVQKHRNNRSLQIQKNGRKPAIRKQRYKLQPNDIVFVNNKWHQIQSCHCNGTRVILAKGKSIAIKKITKQYHFGSIYPKMV